MTRSIILLIAVCSFLFLSCSSDDKDDDTTADTDNLTIDNDIASDTENKDEDTAALDEDDVAKEDSDTTDADQEETNDPDSTVDEDTNNDSTLNTGDESGNQPSTGEVGAPCTKDEDCNNFGTPSDDGEIDDSNTSQAAICLLENEGFPKGYCSFMCDMDTSKNYGCNDADGKYVAYSDGWGDGFCYHKCSTPKDCREGYRCESGSCRPDCNDSDKNCTYGICNTTTNVCVAD